MDSGYDENLPHVYGVVWSLPDGAVECVVCGRLVRHGEIGAFDEDLTGYVCREDVPTLFRAEGNLVQAGLKRPSPEQLMDLEER